jgi:hypothetical protein
MTSFLLRVEAVMKVASGRSVATSGQVKAGPVHRQKQRRWRTATVLVGVCWLVVVAAAHLRGRGEKVPVQEKFVGAWRLVSLEEPDATGKVHRADCTGLLVYTQDGHMSVQVMYRNTEGEGQNGPVQYAQGGYEASFGTYRIDEQAHTFTFHVEGAMVRSLIGKDLPRAFEISGKEMVVKSTDAKEKWRVIWAHY